MNYSPPLASASLAVPVYFVHQALASLVLMFAAMALFALLPRQIAHPGYARRQRATRIPKHAGIKAVGTSLR